MGVLASAAIDASLVTELISLVKSCMGLFTEFPINIVLISSLVTIAFGAITAAAGAAKIA